MIKKTNIIKNCSKCDICKKFLISDSSFICKVTNKKYHIKNDFDCNSMLYILLVVRIVMNNMQVLL